MSSADVAASLNLPFDEAIEFLRDKANVPTQRWNELDGRYQDIAFTVAGATAAGLLDSIREEVDRAVRDGVSFERFRAAFREIIGRAGWVPGGGSEWRSLLIYRQNLWQAYGAGRYEQSRDPDVLERRPYWQYRHGGSVMPRPSHLSLDGLVLKADDRWWGSWYPPNGFGCSCYVQTLSQRNLDRRGLSVGTAPRGLPDPGFEQAPGAAQAGGGVEKLRKDLLSRVSPGMRGPLRDYYATRPVRTTVRLAARFTASERPKLWRGTPTEVLAREDQIRLNETESATIFDKRGREVFRQEGGDTSVGFTPEQVRLMRGKIVTHNHPNISSADTPDKSLSFSPADWVTAGLAKLAEMRAVNETWRHSITPPPNGWGRVDRLQRIVHEEEARLTQGFYNPTLAAVAARRGLNGLFSSPEFQEVQVEFYHRLSQNIAARTGATYVRERYSPNPWDQP